MTFVLAPSGAICYNDVADIVEALANTEGRKYPIPGMDHEDTAQEIRLECVRVLHFYDPTRIGPSPYIFLKTCVRNFLYNQRRGIIVPNNPPCVRCPLWDKARRLCTINEVGCEKIVEYRENMAVKASLKKPAHLEVEIMDTAHEEAIDTLFLDASIRQALPSHLIPYYEKLIIGDGVPARVKKQIRDIALEVINNAEDIP